MLETIINSLREVIGVPNFYTDNVINYGNVFEYFVACVIVCICISSIFRLIHCFLCK